MAQAHGANVAMTQMDFNQAKYEWLEPSALWDMLPTLNQMDPDLDLYCALSQLLKKSQGVSVSMFFPDKADVKLMAILGADHIPQVYLVTLMLIGHLCNTTSRMKTQLVRRGLVRQLWVLLNERCVVSQHYSASRTLILELIEQVTSLLLYVSLGPQPCIEGLVFEGLVTKLMKMCNPTNEFMFGYSEQAKEAFKDLAQEKDLIGECLEVGREKFAGFLLEEFGEPLYSMKLRDLALVVDLYNTENPAHDVHIVEELANKELVWWHKGPKLLSNNCCKKPATEGGAWMDLHVTHIVDGQHFWAQGGEETVHKVAQIKETLEHWPEERRQYMHQPPRCGQFVCVCDQNHGYYRAQVMATYGSQVQLFAMDYGSIEIVDVKQLFYITEEMNITHPALATLCRLKGASPCPHSSKTLLNVLGVLNNLSINITHTASLFRKSSIEKDLLPLLSAPDTVIVQRVLRLLSNMGREELLRHKLGGGEAMDYLIALCQRQILNTDSNIRDPFSESSKVLMLSLSALANMLYDCQDSKARFVDLKGVEMAVHLTSNTLPTRVQQCAFKALRVFIGLADAQHKARPQRHFPRRPQDKAAIQSSIDVLSRTDSEGHEGVFKRIKDVDISSELEAFVSKSREKNANPCGVNNKPREHEMVSAIRSIPTPNTDHASKQFQVGSSLERGKLDNGDKPQAGAKPKITEKLTPDQHGFNTSEVRFARSRTKRDIQHKGEVQDHGGYQDQSKSNSRSISGDKNGSGHRRSRERSRSSSRRLDNGGKVLVQTDFQQYEDDSVEELQAISDRLAVISGEDSAEERIGSKGQADAVMVDPDLIKFIKGSIVDFEHDEHHEIRAMRQMDKVSANTITKLACGFLNTGMGGSIFFGINECRQVQGVQMSIDKRDELRLGVDKAIRKLNPPVLAIQYDVVFHHVYQSQRRTIRNTYVVEIRLKPAINSIFTFDGEPYFREGSRTILYSYNEIHEKVVLDEERKYLEEIQGLQLEISGLKQILQS